MITIANIVSRSEALVVAALLRQHDVIVHVGGEHHASVEVYPLALGGFQLMVPKSQHVAASCILRESYGEQEWSYSPGVRKAVFRFMLAWIVVFTGVLLVCSMYVKVDWQILAYGPLTILSVPVNPQGQGDYYLAESDTV